MMKQISLSKQIKVHVVVVEKTYEILESGFSVATLRFKNLSLNKPIVSIVSERLKKWQYWWSITEPILDGKDVNMTLEMIGFSLYNSSTVSKENNFQDKKNH